MKKLIWIMGKPGSGKSTLGQKLQVAIPNSAHYSFGELLKKIQETPTPLGYTLDDHQRAYDFLKEKTKTVDILIMDGNPYPPTNFSRRKQLDDLYKSIINIHLLCDDVVATKRIESRGRELLAHEGMGIKERLENFNSVVFPEIEKARSIYELVDIDTTNITPEDLVNRVLKVIN